jgi:hypothetical protein
VSLAPPEPLEERDVSATQAQAVPSPAINVERANRAIRAAIPCGGGVGEAMNPVDVGCEGFVAANAGRVRFPNLDPMLARFHPNILPPEAILGPPTATPQSSGTVVEFIRDDGTWHRLHEPFGAFHGFVWVE